MAISQGARDLGFWGWLVHLGYIQGDPTYYSEGRASEGEYRHALDVAIQGLQSASDPSVKSTFYEFLAEEGAIQGDPNYYASGQAQPGDVENLLNVSSTFFAGAKGGTAPEAGATAPGAATGVLAGGQTVRVAAGDGIQRYYQVYEFPPGSGQFVSYQFNSEAQATAALGAGFARADWTENQYTQRVLSEAQAEQVIGLDGSFQNFTREIMQDAAERAGVRDPSLVGQIASDPEMQRIMANAITGDWSEAQILAEQRKTSFWTNTLYPGIDAFYGKTTAPEQAWTNYLGNVTPALTALGYRKDAAGTYNEQIGQMLRSGIDAQVFLENAPIFMQAQQNSQFFEVLRQRTQRELGKDIGFGEWFALLKGEASPEVARVAEGAVVAYQAQQSGVGLSESMLQRLIAERDLGEAEARNVFSEVNTAVLALGESGLRRGQLSRDDIVSAMADIKSNSGLNPDEVRLKVAKLARENDLFDEEKLQFYTGFTPQGTPFKPGLQTLSPEGA